MLDFVNCRAQPPAASAPMRVHATRADSEGFAVTRAPLRFEAGEQVFENYGQPNHVYFLHHGFSVYPNPHDCLRWAGGGETLCLEPRGIAEAPLIIVVQS